MFENESAEGIAPEALEAFRQAGCGLIDLRDAASFAYGTIPGAERMPEHPNPGKSYILFDTDGTGSPEAAEKLRQQGLNAVSLRGGYAGWLRQVYGENGENKQEDAELSIRKRFHKCLFTPFAKGINQYEMIQPGDRIAVCISGGKDSMLMAKLFQELKRHNKFPFELVFLTMDPGYSELNRQLIEKNARMLGIPLDIFKTKIFDVVDRTDRSPCYLCARMRRGHLYSRAKELGCNKIALGHHYDDVIETILMGMLYGAQVQTMMPKLHSTNYPGMELIRPMYLIREADIIRWRDANDLHFIQCACHFTENCSTCREDGTTASKRLETKILIAQLKKTNPEVESRIFRSVENVNLSTVIAYKDKSGVTHSFLEDYNPIPGVAEEQKTGYNTQ